MVHGDAFRQKAENVDKLLDSFGFTLNNHGFWCRKHHRHDNPCHKCIDRLTCSGNAPRHINRRTIREKEFTEGSAPQYDWALMRLTGWFGPTPQLNEHLYAEICEDSDKENPK